MDLWVLSQTDGKRRIITDGLYQPIGWSSDGSWIYAIDYRSRPGNELYRIPAAGGDPELYTVLPFDHVRSNWFSITADGRKLVYTDLVTNSDAWLIDNFDPGVE